ncbi:hypothetical protein [Almyronema epifaneia]|uniref:Uncharacterized protein n=1 Tax=Almyronema epifaneia S1 TaxID=2991925 RepID=A0ABW6IGH1_9CYAN
MTSFLTANVLLGFLVGLLVALIVYWLQQQRIRQQKKLLLQLQQQHEQLDQTQSQHLSDNTHQLRQSYKAELAQTIEHYQDQLAKRVEQVREEYEARIEVMQLAQSAIAESGTGEPVDWPETASAVVTHDATSTAAKPDLAARTLEPTATLAPPMPAPESPALNQAQLDSSLQQFRQDFDGQLAIRLKQQQRLLVQQITDFKQAYDGRLRNLEQLIKAKAQEPPSNANANTEIY